MSKTGLVLEGGGLRGVFTGGAIDCFLDKKIDFDYVIRRVHVTPSPMWADSAATCVPA